MGRGSFRVRAGAEIDCRITRIAQVVPMLGRSARCYIGLKSAFSKSRRMAPSKTDAKSCSSDSSARLGIDEVYRFLVQLLLKEAIAQWAFGKINLGQLGLRYFPA